MQPIHTLLFDLDDTLVDTTLTIMRRIDLLIKKYHLSYSERSNIHDLLPNPNRVYLLSQSYTFARELFEDYEALRASIPVNPFADIRGIFGRLRAQGLQTGVLTNNSYLSSKSKLSRCGITEQDLCGLFFHSDNLPCLKPNSRCFDILPDSLERKGIAYVGDSIYDYEPACKAGLEFIAVTTGATSRAEFQAAGLPNENILGNIAGIENALFRRENE